MFPMNSEKIDQIGAALIAVHSEIGKVAKSGVIKGKNGEKDRTYSNVEDIMEAISEPCRKHGVLVLPWPCLIEGIHVMLLKLLHPASEQFFIGYWPIDDSSKFISGAQARGSGGTFAKRYLLSNMLRLCSSDETDDDGESAQEQPPQDDGSPAKHYTSGRTGLATVKQVNLLNARLMGRHELKSRILERLGIDDISQVPFEKVTAIVEWITKETEEPNDK